MDLESLQKTLRQFAAEREWARFHTPKNLAMALLVEAAELVEIFQWMTPEQSASVHADKVEQEHVGDEVADVLLYLVQLADHCGIDLKLAVSRKLVKNAMKHPPIMPGLPAGPMAPLALLAPLAPLDAPVHVLVDWENVQPKDVDIRALVPAVTHVWIFHGKNQIRAGANQASFGENLTLVPIAHTGKNALDFHLSFYMGYIASRNSKARFVVVSNDRGYGPMLEHAQHLGFVTRQVGFTQPGKVSATVPAKAPGAKKAPNVPRKTAKITAKIAVKKPLPAKKIMAAESVHSVAKAKSPTPAKNAPTRNEAASASSEPSAVSKTVLEQAYEHVVKGLIANKNKPTRSARLHGAVKSLLNGGKADEKTVTAVVARLVADRHVHIDEKGTVTFA